jgi:hypothetical protein
MAAHRGSLVPNDEVRAAHDLGQVVLAGDTTEQEGSTGWGGRRATRTGIEVANILLRIDEEGTTAAAALLGPAGAGPHRTR